MLPSLHRRPVPPCPTAAFALLEVAAVLFTVSAIAAVAAHLWTRHRLESQAAAAAEDLRAFATALQDHARDRGEWPPAAPQPAELPPGMKPSPATARWVQPTPLGGRYAWGRDTLQRGTRYRAAVLIVRVGADRVTTDRRLLRAVDRKLDDGNLETGRFRLGFRHQPFLVLEH